MNSQWLGIILWLHTGNALLFTEWPTNGQILDNIVNVSVPIDGPRSERFATEKVVDDEFEVVADDGVTLIGDELDWGTHSAIFALEFESTDEAIEESGDVGRFTDQLIRWIQREMNEAVVLHSSSVFSTTAKTYQWLRVSTRPNGSIHLS